MDTHSSENPLSSIHYVTVQWVRTTSPLRFMAKMVITILPHGNKQEINSLFDFAFHKLFSQQGDSILID